jgi:integrase/recombinase XerD
MSLKFQQTGHRLHQAELAQLLRLHIGMRRAGPLFPSRERGSGPMPYVLTRQRVGQLVRVV